MITADLMLAFVRVADLASVSQAARTLGIGKSLVSKRVAQLEQEVGTTLFARSTRRIALTPAGEAYLEHVRRALAELNAGEERLRAMRSDLSGHIRMAASVSWGQRVLARVLPEFLRRHPGVTVELLLADRRQDLAFERIDLALRWTSTPPPDLACEPVARVTWMLVASPAWLAEQGTPQAPEDLATRACLGYRAEAADEVWQLVHATLGSVPVAAQGRLHTDNPEVVCEAALAGLGVALLPDFLCREAVAQGRLLRVLTDWTPQTRFGTAISAVAPPERLRLQRNQALLAFLRSQLME